MMAMTIQPASLGNGSPKHSQLEIVIPGGLEITGFPCPGCFENNFRADGTFTATITIPGELSESVSGTYTTTASELTTCPDGTSTCETSTYSIDGDTLAITSEDDGCTLEVNLIRA